MPLASAPGGCSSGNLMGMRCKAPGLWHPSLGPNLAFVALDHRAVLALAYEALVGVEILGIIFSRGRRNFS